MVPCWDYASEHDFEPNCLFGGFLFPSTSDLESSTSFDETASLRKIVGSLPKNLSRHSLVQNLADLSLLAASPRLFASIAHFTNLDQE
jgi:hypothetical protein